MTTALISHPACSRHDMGRFHPERPARLGAVNDALIEAGIADLLMHCQAPRVTRQQLERVHDKAYIDYLESHAPLAGNWELDHETIMNPFTLEAARRAAGAVVHGVELVMSGRADNAFCNIRPPGHHAEHDLGMGFCFFNNVAVGAAHALQQEQIRKVLIVDFDLHHGNGTEEIFQDSPQVIICSSFQHPNYPDKPFARDSQRIINVTLQAGEGSIDFRNRVADSWFPAIESHQPDLFLISAGFDAHGNDPLSELRLTAEDYYWITGRLVELADRHAQGRIVSCLEGGYDLKALGLSAAAHIRALMKL
ncbi:MAG: histone deacetylase family protein [Gammaproteobacteria bacterium]|nr:histone deacetylase family protein [Pseudomonadales bacterium]MCP5345279.1 histone deacetylase family protein [Pseudomonadales bacterium]